MSTRLTGRTRRWVTAMLDHIEHQRVYETPDYASYLDHGDKLTDVTARMDWLYGQTPPLVALGPWVVDRGGQPERLWELTGDGRLALTQALVAGGVR